MVLTVLILIYCGTEILKKSLKYLETECSLCNGKMLFQGILCSPLTPSTSFLQRRLHPLNMTPEKQKPEPGICKMVDLYWHTF